MIRPFKFLLSPLLYSHEGTPIFANDVFYSVNKEDIVSFKGNIVKKYSIVMRQIQPIHEDIFKPDHDVLWYFRSKSNAEWMVEHWKREDDEQNNRL